MQGPQQDRLWGGKESEMHLLLMRGLFKSLVTAEKNLSLESDAICFQAVVSSMG